MVNYGTTDLLSCERLLCLPHAGLGRGRLWH